jgi:hypothetical protein
MHANELVELATILSANGPVLVQSGTRIAPESIEQYWTASKVRLDRWAWRLKGLAAHAGGNHALSPDVRGVTEEVLTGEILTRVWTALLTAYDRRRGSNDVEPVARSVYLGHSEARHRVLTMMRQSADIDDEGERLNRVRHSAEWWTDLLIGQLLRIYDVREFAFDPKRAKMLADDVKSRLPRSGGDPFWTLVLASARASFQATLSRQSLNADLNARIAAGILSCFSPDLFDSIGLPRSLCLLRLTSIAADTQGRIDDLLRQECPATSRVALDGNPPDGYSPVDHRRRFGRC